jgi:hypothetical protein
MSRMDDPQQINRACSAQFTVAGGIIRCSRANGHDGPHIAESAHEPGLWKVEWTDPPPHNGE